jgi:hypothetical protein
MGNTTLISQSKTFVSGKPFVTQWTNYNATTRESLRASLTPFQDRVFFTDIGVGGSEWYSDGTRWRAVGGQVTAIKLGAQTAINGATATADTTLLIDSPTTTCKIPAGLLQVGDKLVLEAYISKPNTTTPVASNSIRYRLGTTASSSDAVIGTDAAIGAVSRMTSGIRFAEVLSDTTMRRWTDFVPSSYGTTNNIDNILTGVPSMSSNNLYLTVQSGLAAGTASDTLQLLSFTVTLKTCG